MFFSHVSYGEMFFKKSPCTALGFGSKNADEQHSTIAVRSIRNDMQKL